MILGPTLGNLTVRTFNRLRKRLKSTQKKPVQSLQVTLELPLLRISWKSYPRVIYQKTPRKMIPGLTKLSLIAWILLAQKILVHKTFFLLVMQHFWINGSLFTTEVRKKDGSEYPPATVHMLLCGLQRIRIMRCESEPTKYLQKKTCVFVIFTVQWKAYFSNYTKRELEQWLSILLPLMMRKEAIFGNLESLVIIHLQELTSIWMGSIFLCKVGRSTGIKKNHPEQD